MAVVVKKAIPSPGNCSNFGKERGKVEQALVRTAVAVETYSKQAPCHDVRNYLISSINSGTIAEVNLLLK
jgi:hypothetical protein